MPWLERQWYRVGPFHPVLLPFSLLFGLIAAIRRALYRSGVLRSEKIPVPVIVVGNITVGGSGKTPLTLWLAQQLLDRGRHPGIISRGYGSTAASPRPVYSDHSAEAVGDEPLLMARRGLCPVWIGRDRPAAARALLSEHPECDVLLSDDGLQHYRLQRDIEIAVVDGSRRFGNGFLLPAGPLRELPSRLRTVDAIVINGGAARSGEYAMRLEGATFQNLSNPASTRKAGDFSGLRVHAVAGIGHPQRFFDHLKSLGLTVQTHPFPDHHHYTPADMAFDDADAILMTEKDAVKCAAFANEKCWALRVDARLDPVLAHHILERIVPHGRQTA